MDAASQVTAESKRGLGGRLIELFIRALLGLLALVLLWAGTRQVFTWLKNSQASGQFGFPRWLASVGLLVLAGLVFSLAAGPRRRWRYRVSTALALGILPFLMLVHVTLFYFVVLQHHVQLPLLTGNGWFARHTAWYIDYFGAVPYAVAVMLGIAVAAGFRTRHPG